MKKVLIFATGSRSLTAVKFFIKEVKFLFKEEADVFFRKNLKNSAQGAVDLFMLFADELIDGSVNLTEVKEKYGREDTRVAILSNSNDNQLLEEARRTIPADLYLPTYLLLEDIDEETEKELLSLI